MTGGGTHKRIHGDLEDTATVDMKGPSVWGTANATAKAGEGVIVQLESKGVTIVKSGRRHVREVGSLHVLVDPATPPAAGATVPEAKEGNVYHTASPSATITGLAAGEHTLWIVLGDGTHKAFDPPVMDKLTATVS